MAALTREIEEMIEDQDSVLFYCLKEAWVVRKVTLGRDPPDPDERRFL